MGPAWVDAFLVAGLTTLAGTPLLRKWAWATEFVDQPIAAHKSHKRPTPYLGGIGLIVAVLLALLFADRLTPQVGAVALGGSFIGCLGLIDDHRSVGALFRFSVELGVAGVALAFGLAIHATDVPLVDGILTLVWIVGVTNAVNLMDNMDGLAAGVSAAAALAIFALAVLGEQLVTATVAAGLAGACIGFLAHNKRPATIFMGDTGSLFLGFVLALAAIGVNPHLRPPSSFAVPLMLLALPVLDTATVTVARLRRGRSVSQGGKDHLSHRLVARGMSPGVAVAVLAATEAVVGLFAVMAGRQIVPLVAAVVATVVVLAGLASVTVPAAVYAEPVLGLPRRIRLAAAAGAAGLVLVAGPATVALVRAHHPGIEGAKQARAGVAALQEGDTRQATTLFGRATMNLGRARDLLGGRLNSLGLLIPGLRANLATTRAVTRAGYEVSRSAPDLVTLVEARSMPVDDRAKVIDEATRLAPALEDCALVLQRALVELSGYDRPYLWPSLGKTVRQFRSGLQEAAAEADAVAQAARLVPALLGGQGTRRYFVAVQDNAELRGAGGVVRFWGELTSEAGRSTFTRFGPVDDLNGTGPQRTLDAPADFRERYRDFDPANTWQNVNVSPDFSVTGALVSNLYPQSGGRQVDGVIAVDVPGLASLLTFTGPVQVPGWPERITSSNLADVVFAQALVHFPGEADRSAFLSGLYHRVLDTVLAADFGSPASLATAMTPAVRGGHLLFYSSKADEERLSERLGTAGHIPQAVGDSLLVVNQNLTGTPVDSQLQRQVRYDVALDPGRAPAIVSGLVQVTLSNQAPQQNRTALAVYGPFDLTRGPPGIVSGSELGRRAYSTTVTMPPQESRTVAFEVQGRLNLSPGNWYHLDLPHQTSLTPDEIQVSVAVPSGWRIAEVTGGMEIVDGRHATATLRADSHRQVAVRLERTAWSRLWARESD